MKRDSQPSKPKQSASNAAKRCKLNPEIDDDTDEIDLTPERKMIALTFFQREEEEEGTAELSKRAQDEFETQLKAIYRRDWETPFREELFYPGGDMDVKTLMKIKDQSERQAQILQHLLIKGCTSSYGNEEIQFLIDHLCCSVYDNPNTYFKTLKMVEIMAKNLINGCMDEFGGIVNLWWKRPATHLRADTKVYHVSMDLDQKVKWIKYYTEQWQHWGSDDAWFSFLLAIAEACLFRSKFIDSKGRSVYAKFNERA